MTSQNSLEISGNLAERPVPELLAEILEAKLDGSIRLSLQGSKAILYVRDGHLHFAVSNQRRHRIFQMLLDAGLINKNQLVEIPDFTSDLSLSKALIEGGHKTQSELEMMTARQVEMIFHEVIGWKDGSWTFSPLAKIKNDIHVEIDVRGILIRYARAMAKESIVRRFKSFKESFAKIRGSASFSLLPVEAFVLSRFEDKLLRIEEVSVLAGMPESEVLQALYALWLGGFLIRSGWNAAFSARRINEIQAAHLELKQRPVPVIQPVPKPDEKVESQTNATPTEAPPPPKVKREITLEMYLKQVERSETHYETLNVPIEATLPQIKDAYFSLAKRFHPDLFYKNTDAKEFHRIQNAFTEIAHAYETLRNEESRTRYDYRLRSILDELRRQGKGGKKKEEHVDKKQLTEASEIFDHGFNMLMEEDYEAALPFITRAVAMAPDVARYHAYFGKVLSVDPSQKFKAEAELQMAVKMEPDNPTFRLMLAEFFIDFNLLKRAEGELNRLLAIAPDNPEALAMLDRLR